MNRSLEQEGVTATESTQEPRMKDPTEELLQAAASLPRRSGWLAMLELLKNAEIGSRYDELVAILRPRNAASRKGGLNERRNHRGRSGSEGDD